MALDLKALIAAKKAQQAQQQAPEVVAAKLVEEQGSTTAAVEAVAQAQEQARTPAEAEALQYIAETLDSLPSIEPVQDYEPVQPASSAVMSAFLGSVKAVQQEIKAAPAQVEVPAKRRSLAEIIAEKKAKQQAIALAQEPQQAIASLAAPTIDETKAAVPVVDLVVGTASAAPGFVKATEQAVAEQAPKLAATFSLDITLNNKQIQAKEMAMAGQSFCLIGPAGSGKTTTQREVAKSLLEQGRLHKTTFKPQGSTDRVTGLSIAAVAYTRRASANLERAIHKLPELAEALHCNIMTIHALLEYQPVFFFDDALQKETMRFEPQRHRNNPLDITHLVIEESSMVGLDLWEKLFDALPEGVQIIFIGDINQLPPVFGPSILNYALIQLSVIELDKVYRQQGDSRILGNAHKILAGSSDLEVGDDFQIMEGKQPVQVGQAKMALTLAKIFEQWYEDGTYDPEQDMILSPYNKQDLGTDNMNKFIAQFCGMKRNAVVYEVISGFTKHYLAVGDKIMYNKQDAVIVDIVSNGRYLGVEPQAFSPALSRFGIMIAGHAAAADINLDDDASVETLNYADFDLESFKEEEAERVQQASHIVKIKYLDSNTLEDLSTSGQFSPQVFTLGYCLTVHKAQGCEWRKVFFIMHKDHATMHFRELVYTAVTRARQTLVWIAKRAYIEKAVNNPRIKGNNIKDKIAYFNEKVDMQELVQCVK